MKLVSLKDYAEQCGVTYEAVRQQVARYRDELGDHLVKEGRQQFLDEEAVQFLDAHRSKNPVVVIQASKDEEIQQLRHEREQLLQKIAVQADRIATLSEWKADNAVAIAAAAQTQLLLDSTRAELAQVQQSAAADRQARQDLEGQMAGLREQLAQEQAAREKAEADAKALKGRGLLARILRRGE